MDRSPPAPPPTPECHNCGATLDTTGAFCWQCGVPVATGREPFIPDPGAPPAGVVWPVRPPASPAATDIYSAFGNVNRLALSNVSLAAVLGLVGAAISLGAFIIAPVTSVLGIATVSSGTSVSLDLTGLYVLMAIGGAEFVLSFLELWYFRQAFLRLARKNSGFSTPATLTLVAMIALAIVVAGSAALLWVIYESILCVGSGNAITQSCINLGATFAIVVVVGIAAIALIVGYVGLLIGIWRLGNRFSQGLFKVGAILLFVPVGSIVGFILILVAARSAASKPDAPRPR